MEAKWLTSILVPNEGPAEATAPAPETVGNQAPEPPPAGRLVPTPAQTVMLPPPAQQVGPPPPTQTGKRAPQTWKTHYVCTGKACGWSGSARTRHAERKPDCPFVPCPMRYRMGEKLTPLVKKFLERCTEVQRENGLPPDGERALRLNDTQLVVTIPAGCKQGDSFEVTMELGRTVTVTVPEGLEAGQVLAVAAPPKRKGKPSDIARKQRQEDAKRAHGPSRSWADEETDDWTGTEACE